MAEDDAEVGWNSSDITDFVSMLLSSRNISDFFSLFVFFADDRDASMAEAMGWCRLGAAGGCLLSLSLIRLGRGGGGMERVSSLLS